MFALKVTPGRMTAEKKVMDQKRPEEYFLY
jgi:hypothetical protein